MIEVDRITVSAQVDAILTTRRRVHASISVTGREAVAYSANSNLIGGYIIT